MTSVLSLKEYRTRSQAGDATTGEILVPLFEQMTALLETQTERLFVPLRATLYHDAPVTGQILRLSQDLYELSTLYTGAGIGITGTPLLNTQVRLLPVEQYPHTHLELATGLLWWDSDVPRFGSIAITGFWAYGGKWQWLSTLDSAIDSEQTTLAAAFTTVYSPGQVILIEDEMMLVTEVNEAQSIEVQRGIRGTSAATHQESEPVYRWEAIPYVKRLCQRLVAWASQQDITPLAGQVAVADALYPVDITHLPNDVQQGILTLHRPPEIRAV